jgi:hypothetical protein
MTPSSRIRSRAVWRPSRRALGREPVIAAAPRRVPTDPVDEELSRLCVRSNELRVDVRRMADDVLRLADLLEQRVGAGRSDGGTDRS